MKSSTMAFAFLKEYYARQQKLMVNGIIAPNLRPLKKGI